ncbi:MAG: pyridoxal-phosphate dependent enzyme [Candidatus Pelethousia sp.]|nr:pyridoxal-phosphate dependent enzyme [Candidatus Pelethousia sp.]
MTTIPFGPTYGEMLYPDRAPKEVYSKTNNLLETDEMNPLNLFNITWRNRQGKIRKIVLPKALTGVDANIVVLLGTGFPSGAHKVGPAYSMIMEASIGGRINTRDNTILGPSTGNFGIGSAYVSKLMGYNCIVIMPDNMSRERYERIRKYGATLDLTPGTESDVILTVYRTMELKKDQRNYSLDQFELMPNYRFHRYVTGNSAIEAVADVGNGRAACYVVCVGTAGTFAAGDELKKAFPECKLAALEPYECPTLMKDARGQHRIEGIGDKLCSYLHNINTTDFVAHIHDDDAAKMLKVFHDGTSVLEEAGVPHEFAVNIKNLFGVSGLANVIGAIKMAKHLNLGPGDNVVTIATDGFDRYQSVIDNLETRYLETEDFVLQRWHNDVFLSADTNNIYDVRTPQAKEKLYHQKEKDWTRFGYAKEQLDMLKDQRLWENEYNKIPEINKKIAEMRGCPIK